MIATQRHILFADDEDAIRYHLDHELASEGYVVSLAENGTEALQLLKKQRFDLAILDIVMPEVDGLEVLKFIKKKYPSTKVIMLTAYTNIHHAIESKKNGADEFVAKPFDLVELKETVKRLLADLPTA